MGAILQWGWFGIVRRGGFPAPLEADREIYPMSSFIQEIKIAFPAPLEVDREIYNIMFRKIIREIGLFPAPLEEDR